MLDFCSMVVIIFVAYACTEYQGSSGCYKKYYIPTVTLFTALILVDLYLFVTDFSNISCLQIII